MNIFTGILLAISLMLGSFGLVLPAGAPVDPNVGGLIHHQQEVFINGIKAGRDATEIVNSSGEWVGAVSGTTGTFTGAISGTTGAFSDAVTVTSNSANALTVGPNGATNPVLKIDGSTSSAATGVSVKGAAAAGGVAVTAISSGTNESLTLDAKGTGTITLNGTATGAITLGQATTVSGLLTASASQTTTGSGTFTTFVAADAYRVTNGTQITADDALTKAELQGASFFDVDTTAGTVDVDLFEDAGPDAGDVGRKIIFSVSVGGTNALTVTSGTAFGTVTTLHTLGTSVEDVGDYIECLITTTNTATCVTYAADS